MNNIMPDKYNIAELVENIKSTSNPSTSASSNPSSSSNPEPTEEPDENEEEPKPNKQRKAPDSMIYSPSKTTASLMQKISALAPKGVPINQLDKRLALLK